MNLTKTSVEQLAPPSSNYQLYWDDKLPGFGLRVTNKGIKAFVVQTRINGRAKRKTVGRFGVVTVDQARRYAKELLGAVAVGKDPFAAQRQSEAEALTLEDAISAYLESNKHMTESTRRDIRYVLKKESDDWRNKAIMDIDRDMVRRRHERIGSHAPALANKWARYLRSIINFARARYTQSDGTPIFHDNPVRVLGKKGWYRVTPRTSVIRASELEAWVSSVKRLAEPPLREPGMGKQNPKLRHGELARDYLLLVVLTGLRKNEALDLTWSSVDLPGRTLTVTQTKAHRTHTLPLSNQLVTLLERRRAAAVSDWVFEDKHGRLSNLRYAMQRVHKETGKYFTIHDLRRTFATIAESCDVPAYALKRLLNHSTGGDVTAGYLVVDVERLRAPMQTVSDRILPAY